MSDDSIRHDDEGFGRGSDGDVVSLDDVVLFLERSWILLVACVAAGVLIAWVTAALTARDVYRATATLVIVPPPIASELKPPTLTVQGYQELLESDAVVAEAKERLADAGVISKGYPLAIGGNLSTEIFVSRRAEERELAPLLHAIASAEKPELAAKIANVWAGVFLERTQELVAGTTSPAVAFIETQYPQARDRVTELEAERVEAATSFQAQYDQLASSWDDRIASSKVDLAQDIAVYTAESKRIIGVLDAELGLEGRTARVNALHDAAGELQAEQAMVETRLAQRRDELSVAREQLAATPPTVRLTKAMTDDAMWGAVVGGSLSEVDWDKLKRRQLVTEEPNPVHAEVATHVAELEVDVAGLESLAGHLGERLDALEKDLTARRTTLAEDRGQLSALQNGRDAGLTALKERGALTLQIMTRDRDRALAEVELREEAALARLDREIGQNRDLFDKLTAQYNEALMAKAQAEVEDVRLGAKAVPPSSRVSEHNSMRVTLGAIMGALLGLLIAIFRDARVRLRSV